MLRAADVWIAVASRIELHPPTREPRNDRVPRRLALEEYGALIRPVPDQTRLSGVRWEGQLMVTGQMRCFESSSLGELCDRMENVILLGRVSTGLKALLAEEPLHATRADDGSFVVISLQLPAGRQL